MRVVHVMASGERGGGADHLVGLLPELRTLGVECQAVVGSSGPLADRLRDAGFPVAALPLMRGRLDPRPGRSLRRAVAARVPDVVHCHGTRAAFLVATAPPLGPFVYTAHGLSYRQAGSPLMGPIRFATETLVCRRADEVVSVSAADLADLHRRRALPADRGIHIANAVDTARFHPRSREDARARLGLAVDGFVVGTVARLVPQKSVETLVAAMAALAGATLVVVGDGELRGRLEAQARGLGIDARFLGLRADVEEVLPAFDVFALPSRWEGEPIALLEAMATGIACVASANSGNREVLADGGGLLVPVGDPGSLARAIGSLRADPSAARALAETGRVMVDGRTWARAAARLIGVYDDVVARRG